MLTPAFARSRHDLTVNFARSTSALVPSWRGLCPFDRIACLDTVQTQVTEVGVAVSDRSLVPLAHRSTSDPAKSRRYFVV